MHLEIIMADFHMLPHSELKSVTLGELYKVWCLWLSVCFVLKSKSKPTYLSRTAVYAATSPWLVAVRRGPPVLTVAVPLVITHLKTTLQGQSQTCHHWLVTEYEEKRKCRLTPWLLQVVWALQSKLGSRKEAFTHWKSMQVWQRRIMATLFSLSQWQYFPGTSIITSVTGYIPSLWRVHSLKYFVCLPFLSHKGCHCWCSRDPARRCQGWSVR